MEKLIANFLYLLERTELVFKRYLYEQINWDNRLIIIKGAKGVGKTTMLLQHIKETFPEPQKALYVSADHSWFSTHSLLDLAEYHFTHGGTHIFFDEVHKYKDWQRELKNIYDSYPQLHIVATGSSMLHIEHAIADLSRRARQYTLYGMSFREYLKLEGVADFPVLSLNEILQNHTMRAVELTKEIRVLGLFEQYLQHGYYPFYRDEGDGFQGRIQEVINTILNVEMPAVELTLEYESVYKAKRLLGILSELPPYTLNIVQLCQSLNTSRGNVMKLLDLMHRGALIRRLYGDNGFKLMVKPEKILFDNTNIMYALSPHSEMGTVRETFCASMLNKDHSLCMPEQGDFLVDKQYLLEVGGRNKGYKQIANKENSFVVRDGIDIGIENKIPLWLFGLLY